MDEDGQDEDRDGDEDVRGRQFSEISGTSEDEDGEDVDVLRRPDGEREIATVVNKAGEWNGNYVIDNMFDDSPATLWHSNGWWRSKTKVIGFGFKVRQSQFVNLVKCRTKNVF